MSPQRVATGPLCRRPSRPPLPPPGSHSGSGPIQRRRALRACGRNGEGAAAQTVPAAQNALDAAPLSPCAEPSRAHGWIGLPVSATWRRIQRRLAALRARGALHARRGDAALRPRLGGAAARRHGALAVVRQPGRGLHLGARLRVSVIRFTLLPVSLPLRLTAALGARRAGAAVGGGGERHDVRARARGYDPRPSRHAGHARGAHPRRPDSRPHSAAPPDRCGFPSLPGGGRAHGG